MLATLLKSGSNVRAYTTCAWCLRACSMNFTVLCGAAEPLHRKARAPGRRWQPIVVPALHACIRDPGGELTTVVSADLGGSSLMSHNVLAMSYRANGCSLASWNGLRCHAILQ